MPDPIPCDPRKGPCPPVQPPTLNPEEQEVPEIHEEIEEEKED